VPEPLLIAVAAVAGLILRGHVLWFSRRRLLIVGNLYGTPWDRKMIKLPSK